MKSRKIYRFGTLALLLTLKFQVVFAQVDIQNGETQILKERVVLITDRETYCAEESILFSAFNLSNPIVKQANWSNIIYLELVSPAGEVIAKNKYSFSKTASGELKVPKWTLTGNYYLRAYTRWMRNYEQGINFHKMVRIINPFRPELLEPTSEQQIAERDVTKSTQYEGILSVNLNRSRFSKREEVSIELSAESELNFPLTMAVVRKGTEKKIKPEIPLSDSSEFLAGFIPETRGVSVSGKVINELDSAPLPYTVVGLTVFKDNPENLNVLSDENGQFFFDLPDLEGEYELFISAKPPKPEQHPTILVDNDFFSKSFKLPFVNMNLSNENIALFEQMSFTSQMAAVYNRPQEESEKNSFNNDSSFYGMPDFTLDFDQYISLPSISEYFHELVPRVRVKKVEKQEKLQVVGLDSELTIYDPLILIDMVSVFDVNKVLSLDPKKLKRIEVITQPYIRGNITYGGIISFFSRQGDLAGIDLPSAGRFISYQMLAEDEYQVDTELPAKQIPVLGNCIYWNPAIELNSSSQKISFNTGDNWGDFLIVVRAVDKDGNLTEAQKLIQIE